MTIFVRGLRVQASIGVHPHEREAPQPVVFDIELEMGDAPPPRRDDLRETLDYQKVTDAAAAIAADGHTDLVETLAERVASWCLRDGRVQAVMVRVEKPQALDQAEAAGVIVRRRRA